ncbi:hypothetical protein N7478_004627 [Penicillium angulare]|uniref:uncharacterized protein n=1 Tax=Penicillium angulare TaxID=116970 RepID=UPI00254220C4|nr:uncharacterized protein N7478_004627 [Penicillium angulare]KAJ5279255.1 hypothetical protein N7478_004627 [Penicillium angulare]
MKECLEMLILVDITGATNPPCTEAGPSRGKAREWGPVAPIRACGWLIGSSSRSLGRPGLSRPRMLGLGTVLQSYYSLLVTPIHHWEGRRAVAVATPV